MEEKNIKQYITKYLNKTLNSVAFCIIIGIICFCKTILFYNSTIAVNEPVESETIIGTVSFIIAFICWMCAIPNKGRVIVTIFMDLFYSILLFSDNLYYIYANSFLSVAQIGNIQYGNEIIVSIPTLIEIKQVLYFIDILVFILLFITRSFKVEKKTNYSKKQIIYKIISFFIGIILIIFVGNRYIKKGNQTSYNKDMQMRGAAIFGYHIKDIENAINVKNQTKYKSYHEMIKAYNNIKDKYANQYEESVYDLKGVLERKNILIIQLESVQEFVVNKEINGTEITPNLNKFLAENIEFTNMHMQSYSTTADSEHTTISSLYPVENGMAFSKYYTNTYDDIFKVFNKAGFYTSYMHGNYPYFWNRGNVYGRLNLSDLSLKEQFPDLSENINGDLSDELLYRQAVDKLVAFENPFISFIVAASSHTPFILEGLQDKSKVTVDVGKYKDTTFGNYIEAVNYADYAFGVFLQELKNADLYDDTAILVFGDHNGLSMYNDELVEYLTEKNPEIKDIDVELNYTRVLCGFKVPGVQNLKIEKMINKLDIKHTLAYLCNIEGGFSLGTNMFGTKDFVALNNERIIAENYYFDENWYDIKTGDKINIDELDGKTRELLEFYYDCMKTELDISNSIIINNLLK